MSKRRDVRTSSQFADFLKPIETAPSAAPAPEVPPARGKVGKSQDPAFTKLTCYVRKETHLSVRKKLLEQEGGGEISEIVEKLLAEWVRR
jgi:hypothetical protein